MYVFFHSRYGGLQRGLPVDIAALVERLAQHDLGREPDGAAGDSALVLYRVSRVLHRAQTKVAHLHPQVVVQLRVRP